MNRIFLDCPTIAADPHNSGPLPRIDVGDGWLAHVCCDGSREHVLTYHGRMDAYGATITSVRCSEPRCVVNKPAEERDDDR